MATKRDLVDKIADKLEYLSNEDANYTVNCVLEYIQDELTNGNRIEIRGFGSLSIRKRKYNSNKKQNQDYNTVYYRMSKNLFESLNKN